MILTYDTYLEAKRLIDKGVKQSQIIRETGIKRSEYLLIAKREYTYDIDPDIPSPPPIQLVKTRNQTPSNTPASLDSLLTTLHSGKKPNRLLLSSEELTLARRYNLIDDDGHIVNGKYHESEGVYDIPPGSKPLAVDTQKDPTIRELISPGYQDRILDEEVKKEKNLRAPSISTPPTLSEKDAIPPHLVDHYGRCPTCGGYVYLPCWSCYISSLLEVS